MAVPATTQRQTPSGIKLHNGHPTKIAAAADPNISWWEKSVTPPPLDGGDLIDVTTMFNEVVRTKAPRALIDVGNIEVPNAEYDPILYTDALALILVETSWTTTFPEGSTLDAFGVLLNLAPNENTEGTDPTVNITIGLTNYDPVNRIEQVPVMTSVAGT